MNTIIGPSLGYIHVHPFRILLLGDYHTPIDSKRPTMLTNRLPTTLNIISHLASRVPIHIFLEDSTFIRHTSETKRLCTEQRDKQCSATTCERLRLEDTSPNGSSNHPSTLRGLNEYLFMCGRDQRICPLNEESRVHRIDIRAQLFVQTSNGGIMQVTDDRSFTTSNVDIVCDSLRLLIHTRNAQSVALKSGVSPSVLNPVCLALHKWQKLRPSEYRSFQDWWYDRAIGIYDPRHRSPGFACSTDYANMWNDIHLTQGQRRSLLFTICTNAIMDAMCIASIMLNYILYARDPPLLVVYLGCAHAELTNDYFRIVHTSIPIEAIQNADHLTPVSKLIDFPAGKLDKFLQKEEQN